MLKRILLVSLLVFALSFSGCNNDISGQLSENIPPETTVFIDGDSINYTQSVQTIFWDGTDADGFVVGFQYTFADNPGPDDWTFSENRTGVFPLEILGDSAVYTFQVKAVDNLGAEDPTPAVQIFPIINTPPVVTWTPLSPLPESTFTVANVVWAADDLDGVETIARFEYALDDTAVWTEVPGDRRSFILRDADGLSEGEHILRLRAVDVAGARSEIITLPEDTINGVWYVKEPRGRYLLVDRYQNENATTGNADATYRTLMNTILPPLGQDYSYWNITGRLLPVAVDQFVETMLLFERVVWYEELSQQNDTAFVWAQSAIPEFLAAGGKIVFSTQFNTGFGAQGDPLAFAPVDSIGRDEFFLLPFSNPTYVPDPAFAATFPNLPPLPELRVANQIVGLRNLIPNPAAIAMYRYDDPNTPAADDPVFILAGKDDNTGAYNFVFSGTPLHSLKANNNLNELFEIIFRDLFTP